MCDTFVAMPDVTTDGGVIFGKNSDRPRGEIQDVVTLPSQRYPPDEMLQCTYTQIPQVRRTLAVVLSKPRWMWGAEMGSNECGVVIGNEAVWTTEPCAEFGLLGMDLLRLGLERGETARHAMDVITELLEQHGQGGNCAEHFSFTYHNSFLLADHTEAWLLETAGRYWVADHITQGSRSISNNLSIRNAGTHRHKLLEDSQETKSPLDFAATFSESGAGTALSPLTREGRVKHLCQLHEGQFDIDAAKSILRDHIGGVCCHGDFETRGSQVSSLSHDKSNHWFIEGPFPCQERYQLTNPPVGNT